MEPLSGPGRDLFIEVLLALSSEVILTGNLAFKLCLTWLIAGVSGFVSPGI